MFDMTNVSFGAVPSGLVMVVTGGLLIWWSSRHNASRELAEESRQATVGALTHTPTPARSSKSARRATTSRTDFARFVGVAGFVLLIGGLLLATIGMFNSQT